VSSPYSTGGDEYYMDDHLMLVFGGRQGQCITRRPEWTVPCEPLAEQLVGRPPQRLSNVRGGVDQNPLLDHCRTGLGRGMVVLHRTPGNADGTNDGAALVTNGHSARKSNEPTVGMFNTK